MKIKFTFFVLFSFYTTAAQTRREVKPPVNGVYTYVEQMPAPTFDLLEYLSKNLNLPDDIIEKGGAPGRIVLLFTVYADGHTGNYSITRSSGNIIFDKEVIKILSAMPKWNPGVHNGQPVNVLYTQPITVHLE